MNEKNNNQDGPEPSVSFGSTGSHKVPVVNTIDQPTDVPQGSPADWTAPEGLEGFGSEEPPRTGSPDVPPSVQEHPAPAVITAKSEDEGKTDEPAGSDPTEETPEEFTGRSSSDDEEDQMRSSGPKHRMPQSADSGEDNSETSESGVMNDTEEDVSKPDVPLNHASPPPDAQPVNVLPVVLQRDFQKISEQFNKLDRGGKTKNVLAQIVLWLIPAVLVILAFLGWMEVLDWLMEAANQSDASPDYMVFMLILYAALLLLGLVLALVLAFMIGRALTAQYKDKKREKRRAWEDRFRAWWGRADMAVVQAGVGHLRIEDRWSGPQVLWEPGGRQVRVEERRDGVWLVDAAGNPVK